MTHFVTFLIVYISLCLERCRKTFPGIKIICAHFMPTFLFHIHCAPLKNTPKNFSTNLL